MPTARTPFSAASFTTFGDLLRYLRTRERLTQRDLSIAVGYSEAQISRLEGNQRPPDLAAVAALLVPALDLRDEPDVVARLLELAAQARGAVLPAHLTITRTVKREVHTQVGERATGVATLPIPRTSFVGRDRETEEVMHAMAESRLVTLTGAGGSGKTRMSLHVAAQVAQSFADGVCFVALTPLTDPALVPMAVASALDLPARAGSVTDVVAKQLLEENIARCRRVQFDWGEAASLQVLGDIHLSRGDLASARALHRDAIARLRAGNYGYSMAYSLDSFAAIHAAESSWCRAAQLLGAADALRQRIHTALLPIEREAREELIAKIGGQLGASEFGSARTQGYALTLDDAMQIIS